MIYYDISLYIMIYYCILLYIIVYYCILLYIIVYYDNLYYIMIFHHTLSWIIYHYIITYYIMYLNEHTDGTGVSYYLPVLWSGPPHVDALPPSDTIFWVAMFTFLALRQRFRAKAYGRICPTKWGPQDS